MPRNEGLTNSPADVSTYTGSLGWDKDYESIMKHFAWYGFRDEIGHE